MLGGHPFIVEVDDALPIESLHVLGRTGDGVSIGMPLRKDLFDGEGVEVPQRSAFERRAALLRELGALHGELALVRGEESHLVAPEPEGQRPLIRGQHHVEHRVVGGRALPGGGSAGARQEAGVFRRRYVPSGALHEARRQRDHASKAGGGGALTDVVSDGESDEREAMVLLDHQGEAVLEMASGDRARARGRCGRGLTLGRGVAAEEHARHEADDHDCDRPPRTTPARGSRGAPHHPPRAHAATGTPRQESAWISRFQGDVREPGLWYRGVKEAYKRPVDDRDEPPPKAPTVGGAGPASSPPVVGAVARPSPARPSEVTRPMIFEPPPDGDPFAVAPSPRLASPRESASDEPTDDDAIDDQWPDEPPSAAPVQLAIVAPPPVISARTPAGLPAPPPAGVRGARRRSRWVALAALGLFAVGVELRAHRSRSHRMPAPSPPAEASATAVASATATASGPPLESSSSPSVADPPPAIPSESPPSAFDAAAAKEALEATASTVARCQRGHVFGAGHAIVTFGNDGAVHRCAVSPPFLGAAAGMCVTRALSQARVPPFVGEPGIVVYHFTVAAE